MPRKLEYTVLEMIDSATRNMKANPMNLGGVSGPGGGQGGPPGGFIGLLPQYQVAYDSTEDATLATVGSGTLVDNLNHIRYRLDELEAGSGVLIVQEADGSPSVNNVDKIIFSGATVTDLGSGDVLVVFSGGAGGSGGHTIKDEGTPFTQRAGLNFIGAGVTVTDDSGNNETEVTIPSTNEEINSASAQGTLGGTEYVGIRNSTGNFVKVLWSTIREDIRDYIQILATRLTKYAYVERTAAAPTVNDDSNDGYREGDIWVDTTGGLPYEIYRLVNASIGAADWKLITAPWFRWNNSDKTLEFGDDTAGKEANAGKIGYDSFGAGFLYIVGAGTAAPNRVVKIYDKLDVDQRVTANDFTIDNVVSATVLGTDGSGNVINNSTVLREKLTANRTYYVRTDGNDSNTGLVDSAGGAFLTIQKAIDTAAKLDLSTFDVTIQIKDGTYTGANVLKSFVGSGRIYIQGNAVTPANVLISVTSNTCFLAEAVVGVYYIKDLKMVTVTSGTHIAANYTPTTVLFSNLNFGAAAGASSVHLYSTQGSIIRCEGNYSITGGAAWHTYAGYMGHIEINVKAVTLTGTPAFSQSYATALYLALNRQVSNTYTGAATGKRYDSNTNSVIDTAGGGANYFPGNAAGTTATGGLYI